MASAMKRTSSSVTYGPAGKHIPTLNRSSLTPFTYAGAHIGTGCIINTFSNIEHDVKIGDFCHVSTGAMINGEAQIGNNSFVGSQSVVNQCVKVCDNAVIASGSVVNKDIVKPGVYAGNPIKHIL